MSINFLRGKIKVMNEVRTRFAPSPTGFLHIGHLRTALFSYALARSLGGVFVLRIEDTDKKREVAGSVENIKQALKIFGITYDEGPDIGGPYGPYIQSQRLDLYKRKAEELINKGNAYYCFCTEERLEKIRTEQKAKKLQPMYDGACRKIEIDVARKRIQKGEKYVIRLKVPQNRTLTVNDDILGEIKWESNTVDDQVLLKSDGFPTYHLGVVVDDVAMKITHITRGFEWLSSVPKHLLLFEAFGYKVPVMAHLPLILDPSGGKLAKRKGAVSTKEFLDEGYLPEALLNFIMLLGWSPKDDREIFSLQEFIKLFTLDRLNKANPVFNREKLDWFNGVYLRKKTDQELVSLIKPFLKTKIEDSLIEKIIPLVKDRLVKLTDFETLAGPILKTCTTIDPSCLSSVKKEHLEGATKVLGDVSDWKLEKINEKLTALIKESGWKTGDFYMSLRIAICGCKITPPINETIVILGKEETLLRLEKMPMQLHTPRV